MISFINESRKSILRKRIYEQVRDLNPEKILDNGCGINGSFDYSEFKDKISACDIISEDINKAGGPAKTGIKELKPRAEKLPYNSSSFDCVIFAGVIQYISDADRDFAFSECLRVLKKGGHLIISTINTNSLIKKIVGFKDEKRSYTLEEFVEFLQSKNLKIKNTEYIDFKLIPKKYKMIILVQAQKI